MSAIRCPRRYCGALLHITTDGMGHVVSTCPLCERKAHGLCRDCPRRLADSHAFRCSSCAKARHLTLARERDRKRYPHRRKSVLRAHKQRAKIPAIREHRRQYMNAYRAANPRDANSRAYQRAYMQQRRADAAYRARQNARKRELRAAAKERAA